jgi:hypothetical protein
LPRSNGIRALLFDLDGTLRFSLPSPNETFFDNAVQLGALDSIDKRRRGIRWMHYYWAQSTEMLEDLQDFGDLSDDFWAHFAYRALIAFDCPQAQAQELAPQVQHRMAGQVWQDWIPPDVPLRCKPSRNAAFL